ncbi:MAG: TRAP transporter large permease subunit [Bacteroidetes bacterium]|nr:TRAP transporter large permease subunit [Bacteroidota bacterium]
MAEALPFILFGLVFLLLLMGYPVAITLGGVSAIFGVIFLGADFFSLLPLRIMGTMNNFVLLAVPLFVYMGIMLEKSGLAEGMLETMALLFGRFRGGLAISVIIVGAMLAASTGIVGATVITMGLISLPTMLKRGYSPELATGTIASSGTLGQIIPPSVVLVLLGSVLNISVGDLFTAALIPGILLVGCYILFIILMAIFRPSATPAIPNEELEAFRKSSTKEIIKKLFIAFILPFALIVAVLGSIFAGIASPTEAAAVGALGATILTIIAVGQKKDGLKLKLFQDVMEETTKITSMVFLILIGATTFALVFRGLEGHIYLTQWIENSSLSPGSFLLLVMVAVFIAGFFIDFIEIIFIIVPVVEPIFRSFAVAGEGIFSSPALVDVSNGGLIWIGILLALNLQTSFLSPPFGFALFYLKGVAPKEVTTQHLYRGIIPFIIIQIIFLILVIIFPEIVTYLLRIDSA